MLLYDDSAVLNFPKCCGLPERLRGLPKMAFSTELGVVLYHCQQAMAQHPPSAQSDFGTAPSRTHTSLDFFACSLAETGKTKPNKASHSSTTRGEAPAAASAPQGGGGVEASESEYTNFERKLQVKELWAQLPSRLVISKGKLFPVMDAVRISGVVTGDSATRVNGVYKTVAGEACGDRPVYKKEGEDSWIEFWSASNRWQVKPGVNRGMNTCWMECAAETQAGAVEEVAEEEVHHRITCDGCATRPIVGLRWKCKQCADYDLCNACYTSFCDNRDLHDASHAFEKKSLCEALDARPRGLRPFVPMIIKAARVSKETRELATLTPSNTTVREWLRHVGFDDSSAANIGSVLEARHMRSKGLVLAQEPAELELVAGKLPAPAKHAFLAVVRDARSQQQFTLGPPPRLLTGKWSAPLKSYLNDLDVFDDSTVEEIEAAFSRDDLKIRCRWSLFAMEDSELISALTASKLPPIVQKMLISSFKVEVLTNSVQIAKCSQNKT